MINKTAGTAHKLAVAGLLAGALAVPLATATPADASTTLGKCTVTPLKPTFAGHNSRGEKLVRYQVTLRCAANRTVILNWQGFEEDWSSWLHSDPDDKIFSISRRVRFSAAATKTVTHTHVLPNFDRESGRDPDEEIYHKVRFRVSSSGVESPKTAWERTPYVEFRN